VKTPEVKAGLKAFDAAGEAFKNKNYDLALDKCNLALQQLPFDSALHEFRALVLFAREDYQHAAMAIYAVLAVSPGWDWTTLGSLYADQEEFPRQLRKLEAAHKQDPNSAVLAFLRGYHYTTCRHFEAAVKQFQTAGKLLPRDELLPGLAALIAGAVEKPVPSAPPDTPPTRPASTAKTKDEEPQPVTRAMLVGDWKAVRDETATIELKLRDDQQFIWTATQEEKPRRMAGRYVVEGNFLFLGGGSGTLVGRVLMRKEGGFNYRLLDSSPSDPGLDFASTTPK
jgi:tetratricopeptide (TPR) repeat protein